MNSLMLRSCKVSLVGLIALLTLAACVVGGYGGDVGVGYVGGVYEPGGYEYGGWGPGYRVGPPRRDWRGGEGRGGEGRGAPSIPHGGRGGGGHGGGHGR
jgi:hypothetical protein